MAIQSNFPAIKPTLLLDFANTEQLDPRVTFARASTATYYGTQTAKAEENLLLQSQTLDVSPWLPVTASVTANTSTAPDGTSTADKLIPDTASAAHYVRQVVTGTAQTYAYSVFAKADGYSWLQLWNAFNTEFANFDVTNGVTGQVSAGATSSITSVGSGWYRCTIVKSLTAASQQMRIGVYDSDANRNASFTGDGTSGILLWGAQLEQRSTATAYTATTTQPITNYIPVLETAASGVARFDHNPTTFESLGLLIEEQRTNLLTYSEEFDDAAWTKINSSITANTIVAPDGTLTGDKLIFDSGITEGSAFCRQVLSHSTSGATFTATCFFKAAERTFAQLRIASSQTTITRAFFDIVSGTVAATANCTGVIVPVGNGWFRCAITFTTQNTGNIELRLLGNNAASDSVSNPGDGYSGIYIWGAQLEAGAFPTSYIPTVASQVTRSADAASMTGTNFSSWYNAAEGTLYGEGKSVDSVTGTTARRYAELNDGTGSNNISVEFRNTTQSRFTVTSSGASQVSITSGGTINQFSKLAGAYATNSFAFSANGSLGTPDTSGTVPVVTQLSIGNRADNLNAACINGHIRKLSYYPIRCTNAQLQALTS